MPDITLIATNVGRIDRLAEATYILAHDNSDADFLQDNYHQTVMGQALLAGTYSVYRGGLEFDLTSLSGKTVISAILKLYGGVDNSGTDFDMTIVSGVSLANPFVAADFGDLLLATTSFGSLSTSGFLVNDWNIITLNTDGVTAIIAAIGSGVIRFGLRSSIDIANSAPTGVETVTVIGMTVTKITSPRLVVTYSVPGLGFSQVHIIGL